MPYEWEPGMQHDRSANEIKTELQEFLKDWQTWDEEKMAQGTWDAAEKIAEKHERQTIIELLKTILNFHDVGVASEALKDYQDLILRLATIDRVHSEKGEPEITLGERARIKELTDEWQGSVEKEQQEKKDELQNEIDKTKGDIFRHLSEWKERLQATLPADPEELEKRKQVSLKEIQNWEREWGNCPIAPEGKEVTHRNLQNIARKAKKSDKIKDHVKFLEKLRGEGIEVNAFDGLIKEYETAVEQATLTDDQKVAAKIVKNIKTALEKADSTKSYRAFKEACEKLMPKDKISKELGEMEGWLTAWDTQSEALKELDKAKEQAKKAAERGACPCLTCSHGTATWTFQGCPWYDGSYTAHKERPRFVGRADGDRWAEPEGWTPYRQPDGQPNLEKIARMKLKKEQGRSARAWADIGKISEAKADLLEEMDGRGYLYTLDEVLAEIKVDL